MPCVDRNGRTVPGVEGQCPIGSTWRRPNGAEIAAMKVYDLPPGSYGRDQEGTSMGESLFQGISREGDRMSPDDTRRLSLDILENRKPLLDMKGIGAPDWASDAVLVGAGFLGRNPRNAGQGIKNLMGRLKDSKAVDTLFKRDKKIFNKDGTPRYQQGEAIYKNMKPVYNTKTKQWEFQGKKIDPNTWNKGRKKVYNADGTVRLGKDGKPMYRMSEGGVNTSKRVRVGTKPKLDKKGNPIQQTERAFSPLKIGTGVAMGGGMTLNSLIDSMNNSGMPASATSVGGDGGPRRSSRGDRTPPKELTGWQKTFEEMKNPEYWKKSMSGLPHDTRLMRLGQLLDYYGKTPKGRAAVDMPSKMWAANEAAAQKNQATVTAAAMKAKKDAMDFLSKISDNTQQDALKADVRELLDTGISGIFGDPTDEEVNEAVAEVALAIQQVMTQQNLSYQEARIMVLNAFTK